QCDTDAHSRHLQTVEIPLEFNTFQIGCQYLSRLRFCPVLLHFQEKRGKNPPETARCGAKRGLDELGTYSRILVTTPAPTVRPPSRIAKRRPSSMAMGVISSPISLVLSPGMIISVPSGRRITPVTSVVLKENWGRYPSKKGVWRPPSSWDRT